jgi:protein-disulfide isomerase
VLGPEQQIKEEFAGNGQVRIAFSPILDLGSASLNSAAAAFCMGAQNPAFFWQAHDAFFEDQGFTFNAERDDYVALAAGFGADAAEFERCYDAGEGHAWANQRDGERRAADIFSRPTIDINGTRIFGPQSYEVFRGAIEAALP